MIDEQRRTRINLALIDLKRDDPLRYREVMKYIKGVCKFGTLTQFHLKCNDAQRRKVEDMLQR